MRVQGCLEEVVLGAMVIIMECLQRLSPSTNYYLPTGRANSTGAP